MTELGSAYQAIEVIIEEQIVFLQQIDYSLLLKMLWYGCLCMIICQEQWQHVYYICTCSLINVMHSLKWS